MFNYDTAATINITGWSGLRRAARDATSRSGSPTPACSPTRSTRTRPGSTSLTPAVPVPGGYTVFAGNCTDNNPLGKDTTHNKFYNNPGTSTVTVTPGGTTDRDRSALRPADHRHERRGHAGRRRDDHRDGDDRLPVAVHRGVHERRRAPAACRRSASSRPTRAEQPRPRCRSGTGRSTALRARRTGPSRSGVGSPASSTCTSDAVRRRARRSRLSRCRSRDGALRAARARTARDRARATRSSR